MSTRPDHPPSMPGSASTRRHRERWSVNNPPSNLALGVAVYGGIAAPSVVFGFSGWLIANRATRNWPTRGAT